MVFTTSWFKALPKDAVSVFARDPCARLVVSVSLEEKASTRSRNNFCGCVPHWLWMECNLTDKMYTPDPGTSSCLPWPLTWNFSTWWADCFSICWEKKCTGVRKNASISVTFSEYNVDICYASLNYNCSFSLDKLYFKDSESLKHC